MAGGNFIEGADEDNGWVRERFNLARRHMQDELRCYWLNDAFLRGYQWITYNDITARYDEFVDEPNRINSTWNRMRSNARTLQAEVCQRPLLFEVAPPQADDASVRGSRIAESILHGLWDSHRWELLRQRSWLAYYKGGTSAVWVEWDAENKTTVETLTSISEFCVEPGAIDGETARWGIKAQQLPPIEVQAIFDLNEPPPGNGLQGDLSLSIARTANTQPHGVGVPL